MLIHLYLLLTVAALCLFILGLKYGSYGGGAVIEKTSKDGPELAYMTKMFMTTVLFLSCMVLSFILAAVSYDVTIPHCDTYVQSSVLQADNVTTTHTSDTVCIYDQYTDETVSNLFSGIAWVSLVMMLIFGVRDLSGMFS